MLKIFLTFPELTISYADTDKRQDESTDQLADALPSPKTIDFFSAVFFRFLTLSFSNGVIPCFLIVSSNPSPPGWAHCK